MNKRILFIAPSYFDIQIKIADNLRKLGYDVLFISDSKSGFFLYLLTKIAFLNSLYHHIKLRKLYRLVQRKDFQILFVIKGESLSSDEWRHFLSMSNIPLKIMYQWDSVRNYDYTDKALLFDRVFTFDKQDSMTYGYQYYPLFYEKVNSTQKEDIDLLFVGIWHSDRIKILDRIYNQAKNENLICDFRVYYPWYLYLWLRYIRKKQIQSPFWIFHKVSSKQMNLLYKRARCIIDINHPGQTGLTKRTMEAIGYGKKLITTNASIKQEEFYSEDNILVIDRNLFSLDFSFLEKHTDYHNIEKFELTYWLTNLLDDDFKN